MPGGLPKPNLHLSQYKMSSILFRLPLPVVLRPYALCSITCGIMSRNRPVCCPTSRNARIDEQELMQQELFELVRTPEGEWLIDDWHLE